MATITANNLRRPLIVGCLAAALLMVAALGYEAVTAARAQRETAEGVLRDYAGLAAEQYARNVGVTLDYELIFPVLSLFDDAESATGPTADPDVQVEGQRTTRRLDELVARFFWTDLETGELRIANVGNAAPAGAQNAGGDASTGTPSPYDAEALATMLRHHAATIYEENWYYAAMMPAPAGESRLLVYRLVADSAGARDSLQGFEAAPSALDDLLAQAVDLYALLPESLTDGASNEDLVWVSLLDSAGRTLFENGPPGDRALSASFDLGPRLDHMRVEATIPPASAGRLVVGGLPYSRLPLVIGMFAVTVALLGAGVTLLRREQELVDLREQFVAGASHELRTPLAQIRMFAETLRLERVRSSEERNRALEIIDREARRLAFLVENLLQFSSAGQQQRFAPEMIDVGNLAADVVEGFAPLAAARGARIEIDAADHVEASVDRNMLRQVLLNLLDNAIKYGPEGQVVTVKVATAGPEVVLSVADQGSGVPAAERPRVWERFWRAPAANGVTGTGIGLALVRELAEVHSGSVTVEDAPGGGAHFIVRLPKTRPV